MLKIGELVGVTEEALEGFGMGVPAWISVSHRPLCGDVSLQGLALVGVGPGGL